MRRLPRQVDAHKDRHRVQHRKVTIMSEKFNPFEMAQAQFDRVAQAAKLRGRV
jgi:hypothetical protein